MLAFSTAVDNHDRAPPLGDSDNDHDSLFYDSDDGEFVPGGYKRAEVGDDGVLRVYESYYWRRDDHVDCEYHASQAAGVYCEYCNGICQWCRRLPSGLATSFYHRVTGPFHEAGCCWECELVPTEDRRGRAYIRYGYEEGVFHRLEMTFQRNWPPSWYVWHAPTSLYNGENWASCSTVPISVPLDVAPLPDSHWYPDPELPELPVALYVNPHNAGFAIDEPQYTLFPTDGFAATMRGS
jgi:hypothetical protein